MPGSALRMVTGLERSSNRQMASRLRSKGWLPAIRPFVGYGSPEWVRVMCRLQMMRPLERQVPAGMARGWRNFASVPLARTPVTITAGGVQKTVLTDASGYVDEVVECTMETGWQQVSIASPEAAPQQASVQILGPEPRVALISDIDDTVLVTSLPRPMIAAWNTFVLSEHARRPVPGMAVLYERLGQRYPQMPVFYVSTGAWNVGPTLRRFLSRNLYPPGPLLLTDWGPSEDYWFRSGAAHKRRQLKRLREEFPQLQWILVGDDGQHDPQLYTEFADADPDSVTAIAIRHLSPTEQVLSSGMLVEKTVPHRPANVAWVSGPTGADLATALSNLDIL